LGQFVHKVPSHAAKEEDHQYSCTIFSSVSYSANMKHQAVATSHPTTSCDTIGPREREHLLSQTRLATYVVLQLLPTRIWSGRQRPSLHVLPQTSEKITNHTISMNGSRQCIQPIPSKKVTSSPLSLHPSFFSQKATLFHERKPFFPRQAHTSLQQQQSFFIKLLLIPIFFKKEQSDNYR
jgi:hypothetical protein